MSLSCDLCGLLPDRQASAGSCCLNINISQHYYCLAVKIFHTKGRKTGVQVWMPSIPPSHTAGCFPIHLFRTI